MLRIQSENMLEATPIFDALAKTSILADSVIAAAYRIALAEAPPPPQPNPMRRAPDDGDCLGAWECVESILGSDADLVFVIPDADSPEHAFWTSVAERMIQTLSAYTGGLMFAWTTRLRPNGREGDLVQSEGAV